MGHYFSNDENLKSKRQQYEITILDHKFRFTTDTGVFSKDYLDFGSKLLLENISYKSIDGEILDMGCGYGPIGIVVAKITGKTVHMVDVNLKALELAKENASLNNTKNVLIYESNMYENINNTFDMIVTNPPIRAGKKVVYEIMEKAKDYLTPNGELWFVIRKQQGAESLLKYLANIYGVTIVKKKKGYFVVKAQK